MTGASAQTRYDIAIIGGSMVGALLTQALAAYGYRVVLLERQPMPLQQEAAAPDNAALMHSTRFTALAAATVARLECLGAWDCGRIGAEPVTSIRVSQQGHFGATRLTAEDQRVEALGFVVDNQALTNHLYQLLYQLEHTVGLRLLPGSTVTALSGYDQGVGNVQVEYSQEGESGSLAASLVLAVDGAPSSVARFCGIDFAETDYRQDAIVSCVRTSRRPQGRAFERFTADGPLALLPVGGAVSTVVHCVPRRDSESLLALPAEQYLDLLRRRFGSSLGRFLELGSTGRFPLKLLESDRQRSGRVLLLGNAARSVHPVAGQGLNLAVRDVSSLVERLVVNGRLQDPGDPGLLARFIDDRRADQQRTVRLTDTLARAFRGSYRPLALARSVGLVGLDLLPFARQRFARQAMGYGEALPDLPPAHGAQSGLR